MRTKLALLLVLLYSTFTFAQFEEARYMINGNTLPYQVMFPKDYDQTKKYPLLIFLHGAGERGTDNQKQLTHGKDFLISNFETEYPAIVIVPQCPENSYWANVERQSISSKTTFTFGVSEEPTIAMETLVYLIRNWLNSGKIDIRQVYVGGLSMGGMGTYELLWRMPDTFAAAFPICGGGDVAKIEKNTINTALWIFHGEVDGVVPVEFSRNMYDTLNKADRNVKYTEYPDVNHNSWENVFQEKDLASWLFKHKK